MVLVGEDIQLYYVGQVRGKLSSFRIEQSFSSFAKAAFNTIFWCLCDCLILPLSPFGITNSFNFHPPEAKHLPHATGEQGRGDYNRESLAHRHIHPLRPCACLFRQPQPDRSQ